MLSYLAISNLQLALLINFKFTRLKWETYRSKLTWPPREIDDKKVINCRWRGINTGKI